MTDKQTSLPVIGEKEQLANKVLEIMYPQGIEQGTKDDHLNGSDLIMLNMRCFKIAEFIIGLRAADSKIVAEKEARIKALEAALDSDATDLWKIVNGIRKEIDSRDWILEGRGSYAWNDDRYRDEARLAFEAVMKWIENVPNPASVRYHEVMEEAGKNIVIQNEELKGKNAQANYLKEKAGQERDTAISEMSSFARRAGLLAAQNATFQAEIARLKAENEQLIKDNKGYADKCVAYYDETASLTEQLKVLKDENAHLLKLVKIANEGRESENHKGI